MNLLALIILFFKGNIDPIAGGQFVVSILILVGFIKGHKLAWQWGRVLGLLGACLYSAVFIAIILNSDGLHSENYIFVGSILLFVIIPLFTIFISLGTLSARKHFQLLCPECDIPTSKAADFLFNKAKCKKCGNVW